MLKTRRDIVQGLAGLGVLAVLPGRAFGQALRDITIGVSSSSLGPAAPRVAKELGLFEKHGFNARIVVLDSGNAALTAIISRSIEGAMGGSGDLIPALARGQKVVMIANGYAGLSTTMVISKAVADKLGVSPTAPIGDRLKASDGLLLGAPSATSSSTVAFKSATGRLGASLRFTYMAQPAMPAALDAGAIQGYLASAPFWAGPVIKGSGVVWISGPKNELPPDSVPATSTQLQVLRDFAEANPDIVKRLAAVFADLGKAIEERPAVVKAAVGKLFPDLDPATLDLLYASESRAWNARPLTVADAQHELDFIKAAGTPIPGIEQVTPASMLYP